MLNMINDNVKYCEYQQLCKNADKSENKGLFTTYISITEQYDSYS